MKNKTIKIILPLVVFLAFVSFSPKAEAGTSVYVSPTSLTKNVGENINLTVGVTASASKIYAVEGKMIFNNLTCGSITVAEGITPQTVPTCSNPYFLLGIQSGVTTDKVLFTVNAIAGSEGQATVSFTDVDVVGEGVSLSKASNTGSYTIKKDKNMITLETNYGTIIFETYNNDAPKTVENFITLANKKFYEGLIFHRTIKGFMIQGGDPNGNGTGGPGYKFDDELNPNTPSYKAGYKKGVVAMANSGPNTNGSQFFIMTADYPLPNNYTIFGKVVSGQDVVDTIANVKTGANDKPVTPVVIKSVLVK